MAPSSQELEPPQNPGRFTNADGQLDGRTLYSGNGETWNLFDFNQRSVAEQLISELYGQGGVGGNYYAGFTDWVSGQLVSGGGGFTFDPLDFTFDPIGAFYDSQSGAYDHAAAIAAHTPVVLDANNLPLTAAQLATRDTNGDGMIAAGEAASLKFWRDLNENGQADSGERIALDRVLKQADYGFYTQGNGRIGTAAPIEATPPLAPAQPGKTNLIQAVPDSNYRALRDSDNRWFYVPPGYLAAYFDWSASQVKTNYNNKSYLIGTDGIDNFDSAWFGGQPSYLGLNSSLLVNFLAGGGDDVMGGSTRNDNLWGGTGNDTL